jgi:N-terminal region of glycosyl transferase group 7/N-terminal domain of galactosyltransferase
MARPRLSIVVPYRDRAEHLGRFLPHLTIYFQRDKLDKDIPYRIAVVEQAPGKVFNAARLRNVGFLLTESDCDYVCFHDVDYLPIWADYSMPDRPTRIVWYGADRVPVEPGSRAKVKHRYESFFGAVVLLPAGDFRRANGYGNDYWGWGYQDSDLRERCLAEGLEIGFRDGTFEVLPHRSRGFLTSGEPTEENRRNRALYEARRAVATTERPHRSDGLGSTEYKVLERGPMLDPRGQPFPNAERVLVEI